MKKVALLFFVLLGSNTMASESCVNINDVNIKCFLVNTFDKKKRLNKKRKRKCKKWGRRTYAG